MKLGQIAVNFEVVDPKLFELLTGEPWAAHEVEALVAAAAPWPIALGSPASIKNNIMAVLDGYDFGHDDCSLTACLNPLHPGPCKGWKHTLHQVSPQAWHALEAARVEKANKRRVAKIEALKAQGKPIPKKLLIPIEPKPAPGTGEKVGQTAKTATGEAHAAGKAVSEAAGITTAGKVTLGQAVKTLPAQKGPKGKKPTLASHGIAFVIAQEKVTPQYKLDKAASITPEQWAALSTADQKTILAELTNIKKEGFGPQQSKASALIDKLVSVSVKESLAKQQAPVALKNATTQAHVVDVAAFDQAKAALLKTQHQLATTEVIQKIGKKEGPLNHTDIQHLKAVEHLSHATPAQKNYAKALLDKNAASEKSNKPPAAGDMVEAITPDGKTVVGPMVTSDSIKSPSGSLWDIKPGTAVHADPADKPGVKNAPHALTQQLHKAAEAKLAEKGVPLASPAKLALPKHVQHAVNMSQGKAPGASWSKHQLTAYQPLTAEEFHGLPPATQAKIISDLEKGHTKFVDPKKKIATEKLLAKFGKPMAGAKPAAPPLTPKPTTKIENPTLVAHFSDHAVTKEQAKKIINGADPAEVSHLAAHLLGIKKTELPDSKYLAAVATAKADEIIAKDTAGLPPNVLSHPSVAQAITDYRSALMAQHFTLAFANAKDKAYGAADTKLALDKGDLSPIQREVLNAFKGQISALPIKTGASVNDEMMAAVNNKDIKLQMALKNALKTVTAPPVSAMSPAQIKSRAEELLGTEAVKPNLNLSLKDMQQAHESAVHDAQAKVKELGVGPDVLDLPAVAGKYKDMVQAYESMHADDIASGKLGEHIQNIHEHHLNFGIDQHGKPLTAEDEKVIQKHEDLLYAENTHLSANSDKSTKKAATVEAQFHVAATKAKEQQASIKSEGVSDYDKKIVSQAYTNAWNKHATAAVSYGLKYEYQTKQAMKQHALYPSFLEDFQGLSKLAGEVAVARAEEHKASLDVPTDLETGAMEAGPELGHWAAAKTHADTLQQQFNALHATAQAKLDKIRTDAGLKKRALPKLDSAAVKTAAAEHGYYQTGSYSGPNYNSPTKAKQYMLAKVGPKLGVAHKTSSDKKLEKLGIEPLTPKAAQPASTSKIENVAPVAPVKLGETTSTVSGIPPALKKQITSDFKGMPKGKYLADPTSDIFDNLVTLAAAHGKGIEGGLSVDQVLKTIDETHAKNLGVANSGMLHSKVTEWLGTAEGKTYAESHSTPNPKLVKQLTGELNLPEGVTLEPGQKVQKLAGPGPHDETLSASAFKALKSHEMQSSQDAYMKQQGIKWTAEQKQAISHYTGSGSAAYNPYLYGQASANQNTKQAVIDVQAAMMPLQQHTLSKRGTGYDMLPSGFQSAEGAKKLLGKTFQSDAFVSSTIGGESGHFSGYPLQLTIEAPAGTPAAYINSISHFKNKEYELLLAAGIKFKVISVETKGHQTHMRVRVVGDK